MTKTVCIVGAGPSGLVAAKTLLHDTPKDSFKVTIFEEQSRIGGLWPKDPGDGDGLVHPEMVANQSRHTMQYSDMPWHEDTPQFPLAWMVGQYLEGYAEKYPGFDLLLGTKIVEADMTPESTWTIQTVCDGQKEETTWSFDYLLVASGFFGDPKMPSFIPKAPSIPIIHSSRYRSLENLLGSGAGRKGKILIVGGQMSGVEIAATIASHHSSALHSPTSPGVDNASELSVHHVVQRPIWIFPLFTTPEPKSSRPRFLPVDLNSYDLSKRPKPLTDTQGHITKEAAKFANSLFQGALGTDQSEFSSLLRVAPEYSEEQPWLAMSDSYLGFVRAGNITVSHGKLEAVEGSIVTLSNDEKLDDIAAIVLATGFEATNSINFLPANVLEGLSFASDHPEHPVALAFHNTHHPNFPTLGFVGFYRSPYWGVMEMQARFVAKLWSDTIGSPSMASALEADKGLERTLALRDDPRCSQFPHGDYAFIMNQIASALDMQISPLPSGLVVPEAEKGTPMDILTPSRYIPSSLPPNRKAANLKNITKTNETALSALNSNRFLAQAVFRSLLGTWTLDRTLKSKLPSHPSGRFVGTAKFQPRKGTRDGREDDQHVSGPGALGDEYLYVEEGEFRADNGLVFRATRKYVWRYVEKRDELSVWFTREGKTGNEGKRADYLFHIVEFEGIEPSAPTSCPWTGPRSEGQHQVAPSTKRSKPTTTKGWAAKAGHLCIDDFYDVKYEFRFAGVNIKDWTMEYDVKGPKKNYTIAGVYSR
ncbi:hypothetical protein MKZ38_002986 [Zalerion maritima]|uniref:DUF6314 domain-containing protein n=1 Tax=Zalerion maritima TaxID=339359 RepID=A0AAD5WSN2_9PEZI|nr:hypothetical protein MKZ38_002986 [Zalerion maritima]